MPFISNPKTVAVLNKINQEAKGLVADEIFPKIKTEKKFSYLDWEPVLLNLTVENNDLVTCRDKVKHVDSKGFKEIISKTQDHAFAQNLCEPEITSSSEPVNATQRDLSKTRQLANKLLLAREKRAIDLALTEGFYQSNSQNAKPSAQNAKIDGGLFKVSATNFWDAAYDAVGFIQEIQDLAKFGARSKMILSPATLSKLLRHPSAVGVGFNPRAKSTKEELEDELGLKIVVANGQYNDGIGDQVALEKFFPANVILLTRSVELSDTEDSEFSFGFSAHTQDLTVFNNLDFDYGKGAGSVIQKIGHDLTETVISYKAATLIKLT